MDLTLERPRLRRLLEHFAEVADPIHAYEPGFFERMAGDTGWRLGGGRS